VRVAERSGLVRPERFGVEGWAWVGGASAWSGFATLGLRRGLLGQGWGDRVRRLDKGWSRVDRPEGDCGSEFEEFFGLEYARLVRALVVQVGSVEEAEDLAQEAMSRILPRWERVRLFASPVGYAYTTAVNVHRRRLRRRALAARYRLVRRATVDAAARVEATTDVTKQVAALPEDQRDALFLTVWFGMNATEAAKLLGVAPSTVRSRVSRARSALRVALEDHHE
jgi:RNA polymerase sigma factor (sigma-70 family)